MLRQLPLQQDHAAMLTAGCLVLPKRWCPEEEALSPISLRSITRSSATLQNTTCFCTWQKHVACFSSHTIKQDKSPKQYAGMTNHLNLVRTAVSRSSCTAGYFWGCCTGSSTSSSLPVTSKVQVCTTSSIPACTTLITTQTARYTTTSDEQ